MTFIVPQNTYLSILPMEIILHINYFLHVIYSKIIQKTWRNYLYYKKFLIDYSFVLPSYSSLFYCDIYFNICSKKTTYYFTKLSNIVTGNESYHKNIWHLYYILANSIFDYEYVSGFPNKYYEINKSLCFNIASKLNWSEIIDIIDEIP
jgi:hypothetical protein